MSPFSRKKVYGGEIFDIDVSCEALFDVDAVEVLETFEKLRELKNEMFFKSITARAKELFQ